jgi:release factor glutamine methyltransferase
MTVKDALKQSGLENLDAEVLLASALGKSRTWLLARSDEPIPATAAKRFAGLANRRKQGEPVAYLTGTKEFYGRTFAITPDVLCPRPDTEVLVDRALGVLRPGDTVFDVGTGSGCIGITIALERPEVSAVLSDISKPALRVAERNARGLGAAVQTVRVPGVPDEARTIKSEQLVIVSNLPYLDSSDEPHPFEPPRALDGGPDGLMVIRILVNQLRHRGLAPRHLLLEHGESQGAAVRDLIGPRATTCADLAGRERVTGY